MHCCGTLRPSICIDSVKESVEGVHCAKYAKYTLRLTKKQTIEFSEQLVRFIRTAIAIEFRWRATRMAGAYAERLSLKWKQQWSYDSGTLCGILPSFKRLAKLHKDTRAGYTRKSRRASRPHHESHSLPRSAPYADRCVLYLQSCCKCYHSPDAIYLRTACTSGILWTERVFFELTQVNYDRIPRCTWTVPTLARSVSFQRSCAVDIVESTCRLLWICYREEREEYTPFVVILLPANSLKTISSTINLPWRARCGEIVFYRVQLFIAVDNA